MQLVYLNKDNITYANYYVYDYALTTLSNFYKPNGRGQNLLYGIIYHNNHIHIFASEEEYINIFKPTKKDLAQSFLKNKYRKFKRGIADYLRMISNRLYKD